MPGLDQLHPAIGQQSGAGRWQHADKGIVESMENQCGHRGLRREPGTGGAVIIVIRSGKTGVAGGDPVVKLAQGRNPLQAGGGIDLRKQRCFAPKAPPQAEQKLPLVNPV